KRRATVLRRAGYVPSTGAETEGGSVMDPVDLFDRGSAWTKEKIAGAKASLDAKTPCEEWKVRDVINHLIDGQQGYFQPAARGEDATPPSPNPPDLVSSDPTAQYEKTRQATIKAFRKADADKA